MRSYARKLSISAPALSEMMNGKRNITNKTALKIFERLNISPEEREKLSKISKSKKMVSGKQYLQIEMDHYHLMSEWYYFGILSLAETENFNDDPAWVAARLNIKIHEAKTAIDRLERLGLLKKNKSGTLEATGASFKTTSDISSAAIRKNHVDNLELAKASLEIHDVSERDMSSMTMAIDPDLLPEAKKMIQDFRRKLTEFLESQKKCEVYKLNIQLFPLSKKEGPK